MKRFLKSTGCFSPRFSMSLMRLCAASRPVSSLPESSTSPGVEVAASARVTVLRFSREARNVVHRVEAADVLQRASDARDEIFLPDDGHSDSLHLLAYSMRESVCKPQRDCGGRREKSIAGTA